MPTECLLCEGLGWAPDTAVMETDQVSVTINLCFSIFGTLSHLAYIVLTASAFTYCLFL